MSALPGVGGHLFPSRFLAERAPTVDLRQQVSLAAWWADVTRACGPATGPRTVFDLVAMPLFARLGFRARDVAASRDGLTARLVTPRGQAVALHVLGWRGWAARPPAVWRDAVATARVHGADWCFVLAPPHLSLVPARGHASRRALDFTFPDALEAGAAGILLTLARATAFEAHASDAVAPITAWLNDAASYHARLHTQLQAGVVEALHALARVLRRGAHVTPSAFDESLTLVYRVLFLLFAESRALVPIHHPIYREMYTLTALCEDAMREGTVGLWEALAAITTLSRTGGHVDTLHVFPFNGHLFAKRSAPSLEIDRSATHPTPRSRARDHALRQTLLALGTRTAPVGRLPLHYGDFGVEQLGAVYERVLDLDPAAIGTTQPSVTASKTHSRARKDSGTFYTPQAIADLTIRRTLGPLVAGAPADRILELRVVDPSMGSGAFLVAALHYLTHAYERALVAEHRLTPLEIDDATRASWRRTIAQRCLYGVDANPVAVQVARLSLWLATLAQGKPLGFLDHRLRVGNSLLGTTPDAVRRPVSARQHEMPLFAGVDEHLTSSLRLLTTPLAHMTAQSDDSVTVVRHKEHQWARLMGDHGPAATWLRVMHLWCARWFWPDRQQRPSTGELAAAIVALTQGHSDIGGCHVERWTRIAATVAATHKFFHWPVEFADAFYDASGQPRTDAGFDAVIGNPPWEMVRRDAHSNRHGQGRDPLVTFIRESGLYPHCRTGHVNLYQPFVDRSLQLAHARGRVGLVLPWGFATDDGAADLRRAIIDRGALDTVIGCDNARGLFPIHRGLRFAIVVTHSPQHAPPHAAATRATFGLTTTEEVEAIPEHGEPEEAHTLPVYLDQATLTMLGGPTRRLLDLRRVEDVDWVRHVRRFAPLSAPDGWHVTFGRELNATDDRGLFHPRGGVRTNQNVLLVAEGKHIAPFVFDGDGPTHTMETRVAAARFVDRRYARPRLAYRDVSGVGNTQALVAAIIPAGVITTHTLFCLRTEIPIEQQHFLCGVFNSGVLDRLVRLEMGSHVTTTLVENLPVPPWTGSAVQREIARLAADLGTPRPRNQGPPDPGTSEPRDYLNALVESIYVPKQTY